jgi:hypothetical protein
MKFLVYPGSLAIIDLSIDKKILSDVVRISRFNVIPKTFSSWVP